MRSFYLEMLNWSEVWPVAVPLILLLLSRTAINNKSLLIGYLTLSFLISFLATVISSYTTMFPKSWQNNGILYNLNSFLRAVMLGSFLANSPQLRKFRYLRYIIYLYIFLSVLYFSFWQSLFNMSPHLCAATSILMLIMCLTFFLNSILDDDESQPSTVPLLWICAGICVNEAVNFYFYLFLFNLYISDLDFSLIMLDISHYALIISYLLIGTGLFLARKKTLSPIT